MKPALGGLFFMVSGRAQADREHDARKKPVTGSDSSETWA